MMTRKTFKVRATVKQYNLRAVPAGPSEFHEIVAAPLTLVQRFSATPSLT
jgi:hypothetical protein